MTHQPWASYSSGLMGELGKTQQKPIAVAGGTRARTRAS
jgi:hypothetical protein